MKMNKGAKKNMADQPLSYRLLTEQLNLISQQIRVILAIVLVLSSLTTYTLWQIVPHDMILIWFILVNFPSLLRLVLLSVQKSHDIDINLLSIVNILLTGWSGVAWGAAGYFFPLYGDAATLQFITVVLFGITAGSAPGLSSFAPAYFAFSIPVMTGLAYRQYSMGDSIHISASIFCMIFLFINLAFSLVIQKSLLRSIKLRFKNDDLVEILRKEKDKAISANNAKSSFLAAASHDLRQPLHAMGFFIESLKKQLTNPAQIYLIQKIERTSSNLRGQLNDLLDMSKIDAEIIKPHMIPLSLNDIFKALKRGLSPLAQERKILFKTLPVSWIIESDIHMIDRILNNLISNAIRYTGKGGKILLGCRKRGNYLRIEVHDTGIGIADHMLKNIFTEYYQIDNPERDQNKGLGLGLSIVKGMCDILFHRIEVHSTVGRGTCFMVTVPLSHRLPTSIKDRTHSFNLTMKCGNIILIDDEIDTLDSMSSLIGSWGHRVLPFEAEQEAISYLSNHDFIPDMIITDFRLREKRTGIEAINAVNAYYNKNIPAIIITGDTARDRILQAKKSGNALLHKPIVPAKLRTVINNILLDAG